MSSATIPDAAPAPGDIRSRDGRELPHLPPRDVHAALVAMGEVTQDFESWWLASPTGELSHVGLGAIRVLEYCGYELDVFIGGRWVPRHRGGASVQA